MAKVKNILLIYHLLDSIGCLGNHFSSMDKNQGGTYTAVGLNSDISMFGGYHHQFFIKLKERRITRNIRGGSETL